MSARFFPFLLFVFFFLLQSNPVPILLRETKLSRVWYKQDTEFNLPKAVFYVEMFSPLAFLDPLRCSQVGHFIDDADGLHVRCPFFPTGGENVVGNGGLSFSSALLCLPS